LIILWLLAGVELGILREEVAAQEDIELLQMLHQEYQQETF
jgi:hypothetical protein